MMKKILCIILTLLLLLSFTACVGNKEESDNQTKAAQDAVAANANPEIVISEDAYVTMLSELTNNPNNYIGKVVQIEGMFTYQDYTEQGGKTYYYVYRDGKPACPTCPANMCGLEFTTPDNIYPEYTPQNNDTNAQRPWIRVTGTFDQYFETQDGKQIPFYTLKNATFQVLTTRGKESV